jgi:hypothetical protein
VPDRRVLDAVGVPTGKEEQSAKSILHVADLNRNVYRQHFCSRKEKPMIRRAERPVDGFTVIRNSVLRDDRLSYRARGLLVAILSRPDNWRVSRDRLAAEGREGRDAVNTALNELEAAGYLQRVSTQHPDGRWTTELVVHDTPVSWESTENDLFSAGFQEPTTGKPTTGKPTSVFQALIEEPPKKKRKENSSSPDGDARFDEFWALYPRKVGKTAAERKWVTLVRNGTDPTVIIAGLRRHLPELDSRAVKFRPHPATWLSQGRWEDEVAELATSAVESLRGWFEEEGQGVSSDHLMEETS